MMELTPRCPAKGVEACSLQAKLLSASMLNQPQTMAVAMANRLVRLGNEQKYFKFYTLQVPTS